MNKISKDQDKRIEAINALDFLRNHPAISPEVLGDSHFDGMWFYMAKCCKRGKSDACKRGVSIYRGEKGWRKFEDRFEEEYKDDTDTLKGLQSIDVSYEEKYGEPWVFDHVEYWYETTFFVFDGNPYYDLKYHMDYKNWNRYAGPQGGANTYEDMLISCARKVKKELGNFSLYKDFTTDEEKANHKKHSGFNFKKIKSGKHKGFSRMLRNSDYVHVDNGLINLRWLKWFIETDYCKKNWDYSIKELEQKVKKLDRIPEKRAELLGLK